MKNWTLALILGACIIGCRAPQPAEATNDATQDTMADAALTMQLIMPQDAQRSTSGYAYIVLQTGSNVPVETIAPYRVKAKAYDIMTGKIDHAESVMIPADSGAFFGEMLACMHEGEQIRVWGEADGLVWDIEVVEKAHEFDMPEQVEPPEDAHEVNGAKWILLEPGQGEKIAHNQAARMHATRWNKTAKVVMESTRSGEGMLVILNNDMYYQDPVHAALLSELAPGAHVRIWIPAEVARKSFDILEDVWIVERMPYFDVPAELTHPEDAELVSEGAWMRIQTQPQAEQPLLQPGEIADVDMTCWNSADGKMVMSSALANEATQMNLDENLGVWFKFMSSAKRGMTFWTWTEASAMPESVAIDMVCRVSVKM